MRPKRPTSEGPNGTPVNEPKTEYPKEFSNAVKKKLLSSSPTGQACDRCKVSYCIAKGFTMVDGLCAIQILQRRSAWGGLIYEGVL
jgi:hypothetical protein